MSSTSLYCLYAYFHSIGVGSAHLFSFLFCLSVLSPFVYKPSACYDNRRGQIVGTKSGACRSLRQGAGAFGDDERPEFKRFQSLLNWSVQVNQPHSSRTQRRENRWINAVCHLWLLTALKVWLFLYIRDEIEIRQKRWLNRRPLICWDSCHLVDRCS